ncbi:uncharacterized protein CANTADRAFT_51707 [Suhomyces tanzawaensis NRRL Y-17324]|uniref:HIT-type domain-containing protein n=1 Tax=Suhomyces tanzawaensis NRRL Y-17324 TaxID=984487 RepID=A0A1E4SHJ9_9ASCO|nr:uncharacterized protein CANTADRAFT_51707 [Suhomyces tanzawaensis NRRL Y-17324]ODV78973.1 hypothetical protein CANTADRAFT_51707 [Suhomyces tanzawaensis NRRL Y-17324]
MSKVCGICHEAEAKYRCPHCPTHYCSLVCFKSEQHTQIHQNSQSQPDQLVKEASPAPRQSHEEEPSLFEKIASDGVIRAMLKEEALQFHLHTLLQILNDASLTGNSKSGGANSGKMASQATLATEDRLSIMNMKLSDLRVGGIEENSLVEEFVDRVLKLRAQSACD